MKKTGEKQRFVALLPGYKKQDGPFMKYPLTMDVVKHLKIESKPVGVDSKGKIIAEDNPSKKEYFVFMPNEL